MTAAMSTRKSWSPKARMCAAARMMRSAPLTMVATTPKSRMIARASRGALVGLLGAEPLGDGAEPLGAEPAGPAEAGEAARHQGDVGEGDEHPRWDRVGADQQAGEDEEHLVGGEGEGHPHLVEIEEGAEEEGGDGAVHPVEEAHRDPLSSSGDGPGPTSGYGCGEGTQVRRGAPRNARSPPTPR